MGLGFTCSASKPASLSASSFAWAFRQTGRRDTRELNSPRPVLLPSVTVPGSPGSGSWRWANKLGLFNKTKEAAASPTETAFSGQREQCVQFSPTPSRGSGVSQQPGKPVTLTMLWRSALLFLLFLQRRISLPGDPMPLATSSPTVHGRAAFLPVSVFKSHS